MMLFMANLDFTFYEIIILYVSFELLGPRGSV